MIPTDTQIQDLWKKYQLPEVKKNHVILVDKVALFLANKVQEKIHVAIDKQLLHGAALTHDIDKNAEKLPGERHPDACVRILRDSGMREVADVVAKHPLHAILDPRVCPTTWEEKLLFLSDKMVKHKIITVDSRFDLWRGEALPPEGRKILENCYPKVKELEHEVFSCIGLNPLDVAKLV